MLNTPILIFERLFNSKRKTHLNDKGGFSTKEFDKSINSLWMKYLILGINSYKSKDYSTALKNLNLAIDTEKNNQHIYYVRASIKEDSGDVDGAILDYKEGLDVGGDAYGIYNQIAIIYLNKKQFPTALIAFDIALELKDMITYNGIYDESVLPYVTDGVVNKVDYERIYTNRANAKLNLGDFQGCLNDCNEAININPEYSASYIVVGILFDEVGDKEQCLNAFRKAKEKGHPNAANLLRQFE